MTNERLYVDFHIIQTVPPSCVNRDDTGRPKTAVYGGVNRARVSSQAWKHAMRNMFKDIFEQNKLGDRTKHIPDKICGEIKKLSPEISDEEAMRMAEEATTKVKLKVKKDNIIEVLFFISNIQAHNLAQLAVSGEKDEKKYKSVLKENPSIDMALFGRMAASDPELNVDAASQVAHSISTHAVQNEYDYFTAVDDLAPSDNVGAGHLGTTEFNSSTLYRYATINVMDLAESIGREDAINAVKGFAEAFIRSMPTGKQNSYANGTLPDMVYVTVRRDQPVNLCGAFEKAVSGNNGYAEKSCEQLLEYAGKVYSNFCDKPQLGFIVENGTVSENFSDIERLSLKEMLKNCPIV